jgi:hypothetical protein
VRAKVRKPVIFTDTVYVPDGTAVKLYTPDASVTSSRVSFVSVCSIVTVAPGIAAPLASVTVPTIDP